MDKPQKPGSKTSLFVKELRTLPVLQAAGDLYKSTKMASSLFNTGCTILEYSCTAVLGRLYSGEVGSKLDSLAGSGMAQLKERYPTLQQSPEELRSSTSYLVRSSVRKTMKTLPGQLMIKGMDLMIDGSEALLRRANPRPRSPRKQKLTRAKLRDVKQNLEDSGVGVGDKELQKLTGSQQTLPAIERMSRSGHSSLLTKAYKLGIVLPLDTLVHVLRYIRWYFGGRRRARNGERLTPEKRAEIQSRRKISPRKRVHGNILGNLRYKACRILGIKAMTLDRYDLQNLSLPDYEDTDRASEDRKRKHDEISSDSDLTDDEYADFDFDNYDSGDDPDYMPGDGSESESDSVSDGDDIESDLDQEPAEGGVLVQLKERKRSTNKNAPAAAKMNGKAKEVEKTVSREADSSVDPGPGIAPGTIPVVEEVLLQPQWLKEKQ